MDGYFQNKDSGVGSEDLGASGAESVYFLICFLNQVEKPFRFGRLELGIFVSSRVGVNFWNLEFKLHSFVW